MLTENSLRRFEAECDRIGLTHRVTGNVSALGELFANVTVPSGSTHLLVVAQAGGRYWDYLRALRQTDDALDAHRDPLDTLTTRTAARLRRLLGDGHKGTAFPFSSDLDFVGLGERLGAGKRSRLRILIHPRYGSWFAFRIAFFIEAPEALLPTAEPIDYPCTDCSAPCITACPAGAFEGSPGNEMLNYEASFRFRLENPATCVDACEARLACPIGREYRYPVDFIHAAHHRAYEVGAAYIKNRTDSSRPPQGTLF